MTRRQFPEKNLILLQIRIIINWEIHASILHFTNIQYCMQSSACVCGDSDPLMEINRHHLQPAVCCDTPISFDSSESAIQI